MSKIRVIGIGNVYRGDDGVGAYVCDRLRNHAPPPVEITHATGEGTALMDLWADANCVFLIDAVQAGAPTGTIYRFDAAEHPVPSSFFHYSTHAFSVAEAVEMARVLDCLPPRLVLFGIEGASYQAGEGLSDPVRRAADDVALRVMIELETLVSTASSLA